MGSLNRFVFCAFICAFGDSAPCENRKPDKDKEESIAGWSSVEVTSLYLPPGYTDLRVITTPSRFWRTTHFEALLKGFSRGAAPMPHSVWYMKQSVSENSHCSGVAMPVAPDCLAVCESSYLESSEYPFLRDNLLRQQPGAPTWGRILSRKRLLSYGVRGDCLCRTRNVEYVRLPLLDTV